MTEQEAIDCEHLDFEKEPQRGCTIGRIALLDCPMCPSYKPRDFVFADLVEDLDDAD